MARPPPALLRVAAALAAALLASACGQARSVAALEATASCERCHGGGGTAAPPRSVLGEVETTARGVGAHRRHLEPHADAVRAPIACEECHVVPTDAEGHYRDAAATVTFGGPLAGGRPATRWDAASGRCEGVYCHGATVSGGSAKAPLWTQVDGSQRACGSCHGAPPESHASYAESWQCSGCHPRTVLPRASEAEPLVIDLARGAHVDGTLDAPVGGACDGCHAAPPDTGAHRAHATPASLSTLAYGSLAVAEDVSPGGGTRYEFGCGHCHPLDAALHQADAGSDGRADVVLAPPAAAVAGDEIKARNDPAAAYDEVQGTCSGIYCHSSGQETPVYAATPAWTAAPGALGCGGCHGNPPAYASGGAGAADANSHVNLALEDLGTGPEPAWEFGHFDGLPGPLHSPKHGGPATALAELAAPITCQTCHFDTVDPANVRPDGFFYFDASGDYDLPGGWAARRTDPSWLAAQCVTCHAGAPGRGQALPLRHVNGRRDVTFDRRAALPASYALRLPPLVTADPIRPYYMTTRPPTAAFVLAPPDCATNPVPSCGVAADVALRQVVGGAPLLTLTLEHATYDPATKTCASVACHLERQRQVDTDGELPVIAPLRWGAPYDATDAAACNGCHPK